MKTETPLQKAATLISFAGHPLLTFSVFVVVVSFQSFSVTKAAIISSLIVIGVIVPITIKNFLKVKKGEYTNFDVSDQQQRRSFYPLPIILLSVVTLILYVTHQPPDVIKGSFLSVLLLATSALINPYIKCSLHSGASVYLAFLLTTIHLPAGIAMFVFALLISASRVVLKRHSLNEVLVGIVVGVVFGVGYVAVR